MRNPATTIDFSVVIPTCNRLDSLAQALERLAPGMQALDPSSYEVIVTDDGLLASAESLVRDRYPWAHWTAGLCKGPAANRNHGARQARGEWLVFVDDDCLPDPEFLQSYAASATEHSKTKVFEGRTYPDRPRRSLAEACPANETGGWLWSCNFAIRKSLFDSMGGFDERFPHACLEDVDFRDRLSQRGEEFKFVSAAAVCHPWRPRKVAQELRNHEASMAVYLDLHPEKRAQIGARYYFEIALRPLIKVTLPAFWQFRGAGLTSALREHFGYLRLALKRLVRPSITQVPERIDH